jgi:hypothetical protein
MSKDPDYSAGTQVDPSEGAIDEGGAQQAYEAAEADGEASPTLEVDPSEGPTE